ncbi:MAG TPA: Gfo/Idh/MocA family oxidoreductase [Acidimicrobiia bacterium]|nr:Gfo/Idh/MocA family oxidoreductase [Acidimicrobiia bacterium]
MIRIGIVGCGHIGTVHSFALRQLADAHVVDARVVTTFDADLDRAATLAAHHDARPCDGLDDLIADVDVVWVCTWTAAHLEAVCAASERSRAVFCEKPLAPTLAQAEQLAAVLATVPHQVGLVLRHAPVFRAAADIVAAGTYGRPLTTILRDDQYFPIQGLYGSAWRADVAKAGGGTLLEHSIHDVDVLRWVLGRAAGEPTEVSARTAAMFDHAGIDDATTVTFRFSDGSTATIVSVWHQILSRGSRRRFEVFCEDALLWTDDDYLGPLHIETARGEELVEALPPPWIDRFEIAEALAEPLAQYAEPSKTFLDALATDGARAHGHPDVDIALAAHRLVDRAYRSAAAGGRPVPCEPSGPRPGTSAR